MGDRLVLGFKRTTRIVEDDSSIVQKLVGKLQIISRYIADNLDKFWLVGNHRRNVHSRSCSVGKLQIIARNIAENFGDESF